MLIIYLSLTLTILKKVVEKIPTTLFDIKEFIYFFPNTQLKKE